MTKREFGGREVGDDWSTREGRTKTVSPLLASLASSSRSLIVSSALFRTGGPIIIILLRVRDSLATDRGGTWNRLGTEGV
jgi:hypothetical protein